MFGVLCVALLVARKTGYAWEISRQMWAAVLPRAL
jgi:hypothetical protein